MYACGKNLNLTLIVTQRVLLGYVCPTFYVIVLHPFQSNFQQQKPNFTCTGLIQLDRLGLCSMKPLCYACCVVSISFKISPQKKKKKTLIHCIHSCLFVN